MRLAISMMKKHSIATTPANYAVWFEYVSGNNADLMRAMDDVLAQHGSLTDQQSKQLYEQFFDREKDRSTLLQIRKELGNLLKQVLNVVYSGVNSSDNSHYQLQQTLQRLQPDISRQQLNDLIQEVLIETRLIASAGEAISNRLNVAVNEVEDLKKLLETSRREANIDMLTGLANRKALDDSLTRLTQQADHNGMDLAVLLCDMDSFNALNEKHGQPVGDQVLRMVAETMQNSLKGRDLIARYGGEEFVILLSDTTLANAKMIAENLRAEIAGKHLRRKDTQEPLGMITVSFGVARYTAGEGSDSLMQRVDRAVFMAKKNGRNSVCEAPPPVIF
ncbi:GGDEF domain protein [Methylophaga frappieri]|uniref:diguanylate cyclase n=2 Tax=Methylophaga frappieri (strain ATCC BAA-2434 / DSM 25690 / JAM7) TaxID=754477 RepID=I1YEF2_METFJ|nr:GGDEF domain protein [Methylophaga frappieri]